MYHNNMSTHESIVVSSHFLVQNAAPMMTFYIFFPWSHLIYDECWSSPTHLSRNLTSEIIYYIASGQAVLYFCIYLNQYARTSILSRQSSGILS